MRYIFARLSEEHNAGLLRLFEATENGSNMFRVSRGNDFFALTREGGETTYYGITGDGLLIACIGVTLHQRYLHGRPEDVYYIRDLRMDADHGNAIVFGRLVRGLEETYQGIPGNSFSIILGENPNRRVITEGKTLFQESKKIGEIIHAGFPLFMGSKRCEDVMQISAHEAWMFYRNHSETIDFALADEAHFKAENGFFLGVKANGILSAVCKIVDQGQCRNIIALRKPGFVQRLINLFCALKNVKGLPAKGEQFAHCYLSFYTSESTMDYRKIFVAYLRKHQASHYSYVFTGLLPEERNNYNHLLMIRFQSLVYGYRNTPDTPFRFPELTLI